MNLSGIGGGGGGPTGIGGLNPLIAAGPGPGGGLPVTTGSPRSCLDPKRNGLRLTSVGSGRDAESASSRTGSSAVASGARVASAPRRGASGEAVTPGSETASLTATMAAAPRTPSRTIPRVRSDPTRRSGEVRRQTQRQRQRRIRRLAARQRDVLDDDELRRRFERMHEGADVAVLAFERHLDLH